jgi:hypothetical protein
MEHEERMVQISHVSQMQPVPAPGGPGGADLSSRISTTITKSWDSTGSGPSAG